MRSVALSKSLTNQNGRLVRAIRDAGFSCSQVGDPDPWCAANPLGILVLDLAGDPGFAAIRPIHDKFPNISLLCMARNPSPDDVANALVHGAEGVFDCQVSPYQVTLAIEAMQLGMVLVDASMMSRIVRERRNAAVVDLDDEELRLLQLVAGGAPLSKMEAQLHCSRRTIYRRLEKLRTKLGGRNLPEAMLIAGRLGILDDV